MLDKYKKFIDKNIYDLKLKDFAYKNDLSIMTLYYRENKIDIYDVSDIDGKELEAFLKKVQEKLKLFEQPNPEYIKEAEERKKKRDDFNRLLPTFFINAGKLLEEYEKQKNLIDFSKQDAFLAKDSEEDKHLEDEIILELKGESIRVIIKTNFIDENKYEYFIKLVSDDNYDKKMARLYSNNKLIVFIKNPYTRETQDYLEFHNHQTDYYKTLEEIDVSSISLMII